MMAYDIHKYLVIALKPVLSFELGLKLETGFRVFR